MIEQTSLFDIPTIATYAGDVTARKHGGVRTSVEAHARVDKQTDCKRILECLRTHGNLTAKEIGVKMGRELNTISGRFTSMAGKYIEVTGEIRDGARVWRLK